MLKGSFICYKHDNTGDLFLVIEGMHAIELPGRTVTLGVGEAFVVPKGVEHVRSRGTRCIGSLSNRLGLRIRATRTRLHRGNLFEAPSAPIGI